MCVIYHLEHNCAKFAMLKTNQEKIPLFFLFCFVHAVWLLDDVYTFVKRPTGNEVSYNSEQG